MKAHKILDGARKDKHLCNYLEKNMPQQESLYGKLGVEAAVDIFYRKVLSDGRISSFFKGVDRAKQVRGHG